MSAEVWPDSCILTDEKTRSDQPVVNKGEKGKGMQMYSAINVNRKLELAFKRTSQAWFPVNPAVVKNVLTKLNAGNYNNNREALVEDLKSDFSLYLYCLKELRQMLNSSAVSGVAHHEGNSAQGSSCSECDPVVDTIRRVLKSSINNISHHSITDMTDIQAARLRDSMLSASTVEALSEKMKLSPRFGFTCALIRQLGLTLIAWNYPSVYKRALESLSEFKSSTQEDLDTLLHTSLGFSPTMLGVRFARSWNLSSDMLSVVSAPTNPGSFVRDLTGRNGSSSGIGQNVLAQICSVGEAFARANDPERYPCARSDWERAERVIRHHLGEEGIEIIYRRAKEFSRDYEKYSPRILLVEDALKTVPNLKKSVFGTSLYERNLFLKSCPVQVRRQVGEIYAQIRPEEVSDVLLGKLLREVVPSIGFDTAVVFMLDPIVSVLMPTFRLGSPSFVKLKPLSLMDTQSRSCPVTEAFVRGAPVCEIGVVNSGKTKALIVGALGEQKRIGVLYLEVAEEASEHFKENPVAAFQAVVCCLRDLLHIE